MTNSSVAMIAAGFAPSNAEMAAQIARVAPLIGEALKRRVASRDVDEHRHQLIAAPATLGREPLALEPQRLARADSSGDGEHDRTVDGRHLDLASLDGLDEADRQIEPHIV